MTHLLKLSKNISMWGQYCAPTCKMSSKITYDLIEKAHRAIFGLNSCIKECWLFTSRLGY